MLKYLFLLLNLIALAAAAAPISPAPSPQALFYLSTEAKSVQSFLAHLDQIDVVAPHWHAVDRHGILTGEPDPGAFDVKALAEVVDMLCLMTYDQHTFTTMPGPVAGFPWVAAQLDAALKLVPHEKLALGIPLYGYRRFANTPTKAGAREFDKPSLNAAYIDAADVLKLAKTYHGRFAWDADERAASMYFYRDNVREWVFYTDGRTFGERYRLVRQHRRAGFASWVLGSEDPAIWKLLPSRKPS